MAILALKVKKGGLLVFVIMHAGEVSYILLLRIYDFCTVEIF